MKPDDSIRLEVDPCYHERFASRIDELRDLVVDGLVDTFHVGSTAVADLNGKPLLDAVAVFEDAEAVDDAVDALAAAGYERSHEAEGEAVLASWEADHGVLLKLHVRGDKRVANQLLVREYLRDNVDARREYECVKASALLDHGPDHDDYTAAKGEFVHDLLERAREGGYEARLPATA